HIVREAHTDAGPDRLVATFKPPGLAPGEYALRITLTDKAGATESSVTPFVLTAERTAATR
ncbi:MAG TPA: hypothetical protein VGE98_11640, partial [Thermoanaerobaculia bacterium]